MNIKYMKVTRKNELFHDILIYWDAPVDPLQWMGAIRMRVQTAENNITKIHMTPVHQLRSFVTIVVDFEPLLLAKIRALYTWYCLTQSIVL